MTVETEVAALTTAVNSLTSTVNVSKATLDASVAAAEAAYDSFDDRYLGVKSSAPSTDNDGGVLLTGALYFNSTNNTMNVFTGSAWAPVANNNIINPNVALTQDLVTNGNDIKFGDNDKATFGAGSDLQIFHDGGNSRIYDQGTGALVVRSNQLNIQSPTGEKLALFNQDSDVELYYDDSLKLATTATGIDVTGKVSSDGLEVDLSSSGNVELTGAANSNAGLVVRDPTATAYGAHFSYDDANTVVSIGGQTNGTKNTAISIGRDSNDISFYDTAGSSQALFWDASETSLGIGTTSPASTLEIAKNDQTNGATLSITNSFEGGDWNAGDTIGTVDFRVDDGSTPQKVRGQIKVFDDAAASSTYPFANAMSFSTGYLGTLNERMRIDSSGNLLVGKTSPVSTTTGFYVLSDGFIAATRDGNRVALLNRLNSDGTIASFQKDNTTVGSIGTAGGEFVISHSGTTDSGLRFRGSGAIIPASSAGSGTNGISDLGQAGFRFNNLFLSGGVYLGGTGAANKLDDYEEGTWTATIADASTGGNTGSTHTGRYRKVGTLVTVFCSLTNIDTTGLTAVNVLYVQGLPFTSNASNNSVGTCKVDTVDLSSRTYIYANMGGNDSWLNFQTAGSNIGESNIDPQHITSGTSDIEFTIQYIV